VIFFSTCIPVFWNPESETAAWREFPEMFNPVPDFVLHGKTVHYNANPGLATGFTSGAQLHYRLFVRWLKEYSCSFLQVSCERHENYRRLTVSTRNKSQLYDKRK